MDANSCPTQGSDPATGSGGGGADRPLRRRSSAQARGKIINKMYDADPNRFGWIGFAFLPPRSNLISIFHLAPLLRDLHARYGLIISIRLFRALVFVSDRRLTHRVLVQGGSTFVDRTRLFEPGLIFTSGSRNINAAPYGPYWHLVRCNLASEAVHPACVSQFAPARRRMHDTLVRDLRVHAGARDPVEVRTLF
ncbi:hypothetical protein ZWY2020_016029 [Hordeum vulgare]|nr:hypothetical protein ZWY2020_016029 [Hordeum vulgare]